MRVTLLRRRRTRRRNTRAGSHVPRSAAGAPPAWRRTRCARAWQPHPFRWAWGDIHAPRSPPDPADPAATAAVPAPSSMDGVLHRLLRGTCRDLEGEAREHSYAELTPRARRRILRGRMGP